MKGAEGLEAGLIADFALPWNIRGSASNALMREAQTPNQVRQSGISKRVLELIQRRPGMTELEIAKEVYGPSALQPQVNAVCKKLLAAGVVTRAGQGRSDPYVYHAVA